MVDAEAEQLRESLPDETRLLVVADHGMVDSPPEARIDVDEHPVLRDGVVLVGGEARFRHLYCGRGAVARRAGHLGGVPRPGGRGAHPRRGGGPRLVRHRAARRCCPGSGTSSSPRPATTGSSPRGDFSYETTLVGLHGSLTSAEMLIPLLVC